MQLSTRYAIDKYVQRTGAGALFGPISLERMLGDSDVTWQSIVRDSYTPGAPSFQLPSRTLAGQVQNFWNLVRKFLVPTCAEVRGWVLYLMRVCVCLEEMHDIKNKIMRDPAEMSAGIHNLSEAAKTTTSLWEDEYAQALGEKGDDFTQAIYCVLDIIHDTPQHVDMRDVNKRNLITRLVAHIRDSYRRLYDAHQSKRVDVIKMETSQAYEECFLRDGKQIESERFLKRPSLIAFSVQYDSKQSNVSPDDMEAWKDFVDLGETEQERELNAEAVKCALFYSDARPTGSKFTLRDAVDAFVGALVESPKPLAFDKMLTFHRDYELSKQPPNFQIPMNNWKLLHSFVTPTDQVDVGLLPPAMKQVATLGGETERPAAKETPGETVAIMEGTEKTKADIEHDEETSSNTVLYLGIAGAAAYFAWGS